MDFGYVGLSGDTARAAWTAGVASKVADFLRDGVMQTYGRGFVGEAQWRTALREMSQEARSADVPAEQLLVEVKQALGILYERCAVPYGPARTEFTNRVVTLCIEEYYGAATESEPQLKAR
jgi:hypothetical protein